MGRKAKLLLIRRNGLITLQQHGAHRPGPEPHSLAAVAAVVVVHFDPARLSSVPYQEG